MSNSYCAVCTIATGDKAKPQARALLDTVREYMPNVPQITYTEELATRDLKTQYTSAQLSRYAKLTMFDWVDAEYILYLDADTRAVSPAIWEPFAVLDDGWDLAITHSKNQDGDFMCHAKSNDILYTKQALDCIPALQLQAGVFWIARNSTTRQLFEAWLQEWKVFEDQDQGALLRALQHVQPKIWILGRPFNAHGDCDKEAIVRHYFGHAA
jgi:lipopolysaccharide biosynthesis glycosyltransferase